MSRGVLADTLGGSYPDPRGGSARCTEFHGASYSIAKEDYWLFRCVGPSSNGFERQNYYYLLADSARPTLERVCWEVTAPSGSPRNVWQVLERSLIDSLSVLALKGALNVYGLSEPCFKSNDSRVVVRWYWDDHPWRLTIDRYSEALLRNFESPAWEAYGDSWRAFEGDSARRTELALRVRASGSRISGLADAVASDSVLATDLPRIMSAVRAAGASRTPAERSDLWTYSAHSWLGRYAGSIPERDTTQAGILRDSLRTIGAALHELHYGGWCYDGSLGESLAARAGANWVTEEAFLERMESGWENPCGLCGWSKDFGADNWRAVLSRGASFLGAHPRSRIVPQVTLLLAEAHETAWSLSKATADESEEYIDAPRYRLDASMHREEAIRLYERYLALNPKDAGASAILVRLARLRLDVDTNYHRFWCVWD